VPCPSSNARPSILALSLLLTLAVASGAAMAQQGRQRVAAAAPAPVAAPVAQATNALEAIGPGDMVKVTVFRNPDLATDARVSDKGTIPFPLIGEVEIAGLSPSRPRAGSRTSSRAGNSW
jgi:polysaccharide export outer membrane protein